MCRQIFLWLNDGARCRTVRDAFPRRFYYHCRNILALIPLNTPCHDFKHKRITLPSSLFLLFVILHKITVSEERYLTAHLTTSLRILVTVNHFVDITASSSSSSSSSWRSFFLRACNWKNIARKFNPLFWGSRSRSGRFILRSLVLWFVIVSLSLIHSLYSPPLSLSLSCPLYLCFFYFFLHGMNSPLAARIRICPSIFSASYAWRLFTWSIAEI